MLYKWQPCDVYAGRRVSAWNRSEDYIIGYNVRHGAEKWALISLIDGHICHDRMTLDQLVYLLNEPPRAFRPLDVSLKDIEATE